jgi:hypothetical protein
MVVVWRKKAEKAEKQQQLTAHKVERGRIRAENAVQVAVQKSQREELATQKRVAMQLQDKVKSIKAKQLNERRRAAQLESSTESSSGGVYDRGVVLGVPRSGRLHKQPQNLYGYHVL